MSKWKRAQNFEKNWWGDCINTYGEEEKQIVYAQKMGLKFFHNGKSPYNIDLTGKSVIDIGGGPASLLLKSIRDKSCTVVDPCEYPDWVKKRYEEARIVHFQEKGENISLIVHYDEAWIYNCLQHTDNPAIICENALKVAKIVRIFEWVDTGVHEGHPHNLTKQKLDFWLGGEGKVEMLNHYTLKGNSYYGIFKGKRYEEKV